MIVRLNRYLSMCGVSSRREADELILGGKVKINGITIKEHGLRIDTEKDTVHVGKKVIRPERKRYILLNKPRLYLTSIGKQEGKKTILELIKDIPERVYPVGRLDYDSEGLLILTNDGEIANRILHPRYKLSKVYLAAVKGKVSKETFSKMIAGTGLEDGFTKPDSLKIVRYQETSTLIEIEFHEGRNRLVKRFFASFDHNVERLQRIAVGPIKLGKLPKGTWRDMTSKELDGIKSLL